MKLNDLSDNSIFKTLWKSVNMVQGSPLNLLNDPPKRKRYTQVLNDYQFSINKIEFQPVSDLKNSWFPRHVICYDYDKVYYCSELSEMVAVNFPKEDMRLRSAVNLSIRNRNSISEENQRAIIALLPRQLGRQYYNTAFYHSTGTNANTYYRAENSFLGSMLWGPKKSKLIPHLPPPLGGCAPFLTGKIPQLISFLPDPESRVFFNSPIVKSHSPLLAKTIEQRLNSCQLIYNLLKNSTNRIIFKNNYPNIIIYLDDLFYKFSADQKSDSFDNLFSSVLSGYIDYYLHQDNIQLECSLRAGFGYVISSLSNMPTGIRLSPGIQPREVILQITRAIGHFIIDIEFFASQLVNKTMTLSRESQFAGFYSGHPKYRDLVKYLCFYDENKDSNPVFLLAGNPALWCDYFKTITYVALKNNSKSNIFKQLIDSLVKSSSVDVKNKNIFITDESWKRKYTYRDVHCSWKKEGNRDFCYIVEEVLKRVDNAFIKTLIYRDLDDVTDVVSVLAGALHNIFERSFCYNYGKTSRQKNQNIYSLSTVNQEGESCGLFYQERVLNTGMVSLFFAIQLAKNLYPKIFNVKNNLSQKDSSKIGIANMYYEIYNKGVLAKDEIAKTFEKAAILIGDMNHCVLSLEKFDSRKNIDALNWGNKIVILDATSSTPMQRKAMIDILRCNQKKIILMFIFSSVKLLNYGGSDLNYFGLYWLYCDAEYKKIVKNTTDSLLGKRNVFLASFRCVSSIHYLRILNMLPGADEFSELIEKQRKFLKQQPLPPSIDYHPPPGIRISRMSFDPFKLILDILNHQVPNHNGFNPSQKKIIDLTVSHPILASHKKSTQLANKQKIRNRKRKRDDSDGQPGTIIKLNNGCEPTINDFSLNNKRRRLDFSLFDAPLQQSEACLPVAKLANPSASPRNISKIY